MHSSPPVLYSVSDIQTQQNYNAYTVACLRLLSRLWQLPPSTFHESGKTAAMKVVNEGKRAPTFLGLGPFTEYNSDS